jgi:hypothetical protein
LFSLLGAYCIFRSRLKLTPEGVEQRGLFTTRFVRNEEIRGYRFQGSDNGGSYRFELHEGRKLSISEYYNLDANFHAWRICFDDLDLRDQRAEKQKIFNDPDLGHTRAERVQILDAQRRIARYCNVVGGAVCCWALLFPRPYLLVIALTAATPLVALFFVLRSHDLLRFLDDKKFACPDVTFAVVGPIFLLWMRAVLDVDLLACRGLLFTSLPLAVVLTFLARQADSKLRAKPLMQFIMLCFMYLYSYSALVEADRLLDHSEPYRYPSAVTRMEVSHGKSTTYTLSLQPWGPQAQPSNVDVSQSFYDSVKVGDLICVELHPGSLHAPWYELAHCPASTTPSRRVSHPPL